MMFFLSPDKKNAIATDDTNAHGAKAKKPTAIQNTQSFKQFGNKKYV